MVQFGMVSAFFDEAQLHLLASYAKRVAHYSICCSCNSADESRNHLFFYCCYTEQVWEKSAKYKWNY